MSRQKKINSVKVNYKDLASEILNNISATSSTEPNKTKLKLFTLIPIAISILALILSAINYVEIRKSNMPLFVSQRGDTNLDGIVERSLGEQFGLLREDQIRNVGGKIEFIKGDLNFMMMVISDEHTLFVPYNLSGNKDVYYDYQENVIKFRYYYDKGTIVVNNLMSNFQPNTYSINKESPGDIWIGILQYASITYKDYYGKSHVKYYTWDAFKNVLIEINKEEIPKINTQLEWSKFTSTEQIYTDICKELNLPEIAYYTYMDEDTIK